MSLNDQLCLKGLKGKNKSKQESSVLTLYSPLHPLVQSNGEVRQVFQRDQPYKSVPAAFELVRETSRKQEWLVLIKHSGFLWRSAL